MKPLFLAKVDDAQLLQAVPTAGKHNQKISSHRSEILQQYAMYRSVLRRPVQGVPKIDEDLKGALHAKYTEGRGGSGVFSFIEERAERSRLRSCPYCGRGGLGTMDHYLPKEHFSWFSVYSWNLVPSCQECQNVKGSKFGSLGGRRPIHPLLDRIGLAQVFVVRPIFHAPDVMLTTFKMSVIPDRSFSRKIRKREKHLFQSHWRFFGEDRQDVISACRTSLSDIRIELHSQVNPTSFEGAARWIDNRLRRAFQFEDVSSDNLLFIGLLLALTTDRYSLEQLLATQLPAKALSRRDQQSLLRVR